MHNICKVHGSNPDHQKKKIIHLYGEVTNLRFKFNPYKRHDNNNVTICAYNYNLFTRFIFYLDINDISIISISK